jgi:hypothetical protein
MSSQKQIDANRQNAQNAHGATSPEGKQRSSLNATKHGWTGQTLVLSPEEQAPYAQFVKDYFEEWTPFDVTTRQLTQQLADAHWSLHQIFVQQSNLLAMINAATVQLNETTDAITAATTIAKLSKTLNTYSIYETRRRRFADAIELKLVTLVNDRTERLKNEIPEAAKLAKAMKTQGKPFNPVDFGFICSAADIEQFLEGQELARSCQNPPTMTLADVKTQIANFLAAEQAAERTK